MSLLVLGPAAGGFPRCLHGEVSHQLPCPGCEIVGPGSGSCRITCGCKGTASLRGWVGAVPGAARRGSQGSHSAAGFLRRSCLRVAVLRGCPFPGPVAGEGLWGHLLALPTSAAPPPGGNTPGRRAFHLPGLGLLVCDAWDFSCT